jgi:hypothetical protein
MVQETNEFVDLTVDGQDRPEAHTVQKRKFRLPREGPVLAQKSRVALDEYRLNWRTRALGNEREPALELIDEGTARARTFRKDQQLSAGANLPNAIADKVGGLVVSNESGKARASPEKRVP